MKNIIIKYLLFFLPLLMMATGCTKRFTDINTNPAGISSDAFKADFQQVILTLQNAQKSIVHYTQYQIQENLNADIYSGYMMTPTPFNGGNNNSNYFMMDGWNTSILNAAYNDVLQSVSDYYRLSKDYSGVDFSFPDAMAKMIRVIDMHRVADVFGPVIYTHYGQPNADLSVDYDSQKDAYTAFFADLDTVTMALKPFVTGSKKVLPAFAKADLVYGGNAANWLMLANTLRLRLALRIVYADAATAKMQGENALAATGGLITDNSANALIDFGMRHPMSEIIGWGDIRSGAPLGSMLGGYHDPRITHYMAPAIDVAVTGQYIGIRNGIAIDSKDRYSGFSIPMAKSASADYFDANDGKAKIASAAETWFLKAEAALHNWAGAGNAQTDYETGIAKSFEEWGAGSASAYISDASSSAAPYTDPKAKTTGQNDIATGDRNLSTITIKWDEAAALETKLERIITQKWIALYPDGQEAWSEFRRTGYPKLFPVVVNNSGGTITGFIKRLPIPSQYQSNNQPGYKKAVETLGGPDNGGTRLWWDKK
jgi:hypothetical protein